MPRDESLHRQCMMTAFTVACVFLASYLTRTALTGSHSYPGEGADKLIYLLVLFSHMILAALIVPFVLWAIRAALKERRKTHRRIVRWLWPAWVYVSVTGIFVYVMLYHIGPKLA